MLTKWDMIWLYIHKIKKCIEITEQIKYRRLTRAIASGFERLKIAFGRIHVESEENDFTVSTTTQSP